MLGPAQIFVYRRTRDAAAPGGLSFRRLALSKSANAWIYAATGLFAAFSAAGIAPWALGLGEMRWPFLLFAGICPPLWVAVVMICGADRTDGYDLPDAPDATENPVKAPPLVLDGPEWPDAPRAVFRHTESVTIANNNTGPASTSLSRLLMVARDMRGNPSSQPRRERVLLPHPDRMSELPDLPFLRSGS